MLLQGTVRSNPIYWMRKWKVIIVLDDNEIGLDVSELRIKFRVIKNILTSSHKADITIYNLNPDTEKRILSRSTKVYLEAGYEDPDLYGQIFVGDVIQPLRGREGQTETFVKLKCLAEDDILNFGICNFTIPRGSNYRDLITAASVKSNYPFEIENIPDNWGDKKLSRALSLFGPTKNILNGIAKDQNCIIRIDSGKARIISLNDEAKADTAFVMNKRTGMMNAQQTPDGIFVNHLINPKVILGEWLKLDNADIAQNEIEVGELQYDLDLDGLYRIVGQEITGDTHGNDWYIKETCITQLGALPTMLQDPQQRGI